MPKPAITTFSSVAVTPISTNKNNGLYAPELTTIQRNKIPQDTLRNGALIYNLTTTSLQSYENNVWVDLGAAGGNVVGPNVAVNQNIAIFNGASGKIIEDSGVVITAVPGPVLQNSFRAKKADALVDVNQIGNLGHIQFINDIGLIFVDSLLPLEFITNDIGGDEQVCSLFTGGLPSSSTTPSALVELQTTTGALLLSRLTEVEKDALFSAPGMVLFNTDTKKLDINNGTTWNELATTSSSDNFASELYLSTSTDFIQDVVTSAGSDFTWSSSLKILLRGCVGGSGISSTVDGVNWIDDLSFPFTAGCVSWSNELEVFSAREASGSGTGYCTSVDGLTWSIVSNVASQFESFIIYSSESNRFYAANSEVNSRIYSSVDGSTYSADSSNRWAAGFAFGNGVTVAVGGDGPQYIPAINTGTWINSAATFSAQDVAFSPELGYYVAIPRIIDKTSSYTSIDGINWTTHTNAFNSTEDKRFIEWIPALSMFICGGDNEFYGISKDGITFKEVADFTFAVGNDITGGIYVEEWGELLFGGNNLGLTRTEKRFIY